MKLISLNTKPSHTFAINFVVASRVSAELCDLKVKKVFPIESIPSQILRGNLNIVTDIFHEHFNASIDDGIFPTVLKIGGNICIHSK